MSKFLIRRFVKDFEKTDSPAVRSVYGKLLGWLGIFCNLLLFLMKGAVGIVAGSVSITADAVNSLSDAASSVISLMGFKLSERPADAEHPYGHGRYEYFAGLMVSVLIIVIGVELVQNSVAEIFKPSPVDLNWIYAVVLTASIVLKIWLMLFNRKAGAAIASATLSAAAADSRNDIITTGAVLASALISRFADVDLDGWTGLVVAAFILVSGVGLIRATLNPILGRAPDAEAVRHIQIKIMSYPGVIGAHDLLVHDYGPGRQFASVHVEMAAEADALESHEVIDTIERDFAQEGLHLVVHHDPIVTGDGATDDLRAWLAGEVRIIDPGFTIHDLHIAPQKGGMRLIFDCAVPTDTSMTDGEIRVAVGALVRKTYPEYSCSVVIDRNFAAIPKEV